jgi:RNA polymerase sigma-70 factor (ECF subfamily)
LIQSFFLRLLESDGFAAADPARGRFRTFLLAALDHFRANEWRRENAQKRGGGQTIRSLDFDADLDAGEGRYARESIEPADDRETPEALFERRWAMALLARASDRLRAEQMAGDRRVLAEKLMAVLAGESEESYAEIARACDMTEGAVKVAAHRLRGRYREILRTEVAQTLAEGESIDEELQALFRAVEGG